MKIEKCIPELLAKRDHKAMVSRIQQAMKDNGMEYMILTHVQDTFYASGYMPLMPSAVTLVPADGNVVLIVSTLENEAAESLTCEDVEVRAVRSWTFVDDGTPKSRSEAGTVIDPDGAVGVVLDILCAKKLQGKVGINKAIVPKRFWDKLLSRLPEETFEDCAKMLLNLRILKTPWEIEVLKLAAQEAEKAYEFIVEELKPGMPAWKIDAMYMYYSAKSNLDHGAMSRRSVFLTSQGDYYGLSGMPRGYILQKGDVIKLDCGFRYVDHTSDIGRTCVVGGECTKEAEETYNILYHAYALGRDMLRPGLNMKDLYWAMREDVEKSSLIPAYPRGNLGHSVGCGHHAEEYPTISKDTDFILQPGMVICLETPYSGIGGAPARGSFNIEDTYAITENGVEAFTHAPDNIFYRH